MFGNCQKAPARTKKAAVPESLVQLTVSGDLVRGSAVRVLHRREQLGARFGNLREDSFFQARDSLHRSNDIRDQISASLHLVFNLRPLGIHVLLSSDKRVIGADGAAADN